MITFINKLGPYLSESHQKMKDTMFLTHRLLRTIVIVAALIVLLSTACGDNEDVPMTVPPKTQAGTLVNMTACAYHTGGTDYDADCGTLIVPENRHDPSARLIALPLIRIKSTGSASNSAIFWLNGGPGQSNMRFSHPEDLTALIENHDFVLIGYRGVDGSVKLDCPEISQVLGKPPGQLLSDGALASYGAASARCVERLQSEGIDLIGYTMTETIDDMEAARTALGYERINLLGVSYGTRLAPSSGRRWSLIDRSAIMLCCVARTQIVEPAPTTWHRRCVLFPRRCLTVGYSSPLMKIR